MPPENPRFCACLHVGDRVAPSSERLPALGTSVVVYDDDCVGPPIRRHERPDGDRRVVGRAEVEHDGGQTRSLPWPLGPRRDVRFVQAPRRRHVVFERSNRRRGRAGPQAIEQSRLLDESRQRALEPVHISRLEQQSVALVLHQLGDAADVRRDDGQPRQEGFADDDRARLGPDRGHDQHVERMPAPRERARASEDRVRARRAATAAARAPLGSWCRRDSPPAHQADRRWPSPGGSRRNASSRRCGAFDTISVPRKPMRSGSPWGRHPRCARML